LFFGYGKSPEGPKLVTPDDESSILLTNCVLSWSDVSNAQSYHIQVDNNPDFTSPFIDDMSINNNQYTVTAELKINTEYFWRARAKYSWSNWSAWSKERSFITSFYFWKYQTGAAVSSSPAIGFDGTIYFGSRDQYIYALNPDGNLKWKYQTTGEVESSPAIGSNGTVYIGSNDHFVYALNADGILKWRYETKDEVKSSAAIGLDGTIYIGSDDCYLYALSADGNLKWKYHSEDWIRSSPVIGLEGTVYVCSNVRYADYFYLHALNRDGNLVWKNKINGGIASSPSIGSDGTIYLCSTNDAHVYAFNVDGSLRWKYKIYSHSSPIIGPNSTIYLGGIIGIHALNLDGNLEWETYLDLPFADLTSPTIGSDGIIYAGSYYPGSADFYAFDQDGTLKRKYYIGSTGKSCPAISSDGTIYVGAKDGCLYALRGFSAGLANSPWPKFRHDNQNTGRTEF